MLIGVTPMIRMVCEMDCDQTRPASPACHTSSPSHDIVSWRTTPHGCNHDHSFAKPALVTSSNDRDASGAFAALVSQTIEAVPFDVHARPAGSGHGPPGLRTDTHPARTTTLRI
jgi:hypothetical protein